MLSLDSSVLIQVGSFLFFCFLIKRFLFDPVSCVLEERQKQTQGRQKKADELFAEAHRLEVELTRRMEEAKRELAIKREENERVIRQEEERLLRIAREETERGLMDARRLIQEEMQRARSLLQSEASDLSLEIVRKVLG
jgi:F-type H+-transporting ATPase subunit b